MIFDSVSNRRYGYFHKGWGSRCTNGPNAPIVWRETSCTIQLGAEASAVFRGRRMAKKMGCKEVQEGKKASLQRCNIVQTYRSLLADTFHNKTLDVRALGVAQTKAMPTLDFLAQLKQEPGDNTLNLRDLARVHRTVFTMMPRYRLLEALAENCHSDPFRSERTVSRGWH